MDILFLIGSIAAAVFGFFVMFVDATFGLGLIGISCALALWARFLQSNNQQSKVLERIEQIGRKLHEAILATIERRQ